MRFRSLMLSAVVASLMVAPTLLRAQDQNQQPNDRGGQRNDQQQGGGRMGRGNFDPAQFRQQMEDRLKEQLGTNEDEWKVLQPKVQKVFDAQRDAGRGFGFGGMGRRGGGGGGGGFGGGGGGSDQPQSAVAKAQQDLRTTLDNKSASADEISAKLTALRDARTKARADLEAAQKELKEVLTARQEAVLVSMGM